jgi:Outer membrane protein beta-barrel domain
LRLNEFKKCLVVAAAAVACTASPAAAQSWSERVLISVNGAFQSTTHDASDRFEFEKNLETGTTDVDYSVHGGFVFDGGVSYRVWKNLAGGVSVSYFTRDESASTTSSIPHPFFFQQPRIVTGDATGVKRTETAVHVQAVYLVNPGGKLRMAFSGGPTFFNLEQDLVTEATVTEAYPFDTVTFATAQKRRESGSTVTFNVGADLMWMLSRQFGIGGLVRFSPASVDLDAPGNRTISVDGGGVYAGGGIRILF